MRGASLKNSFTVFGVVAIAILLNVAVWGWFLIWLAGRF